LYVGKRNGVAANIKEEHPETVIIHCLAHHLELAFKDATKNFGSRLYEKTTTLLLGWCQVYLTKSDIIIIEYSVI
jgi:hypothetical protein